MKNELQRITVRLFGILFILGMIGMHWPNTSLAATDASKTITSLEFTNIELPVNGETPKYTVTIPDGAHYHLATQTEIESFSGTMYEKDYFQNGLKWRVKNSTNKFYNVDSTYLFQSGDTCRFEIYVCADSGYEFSGSLNVNANGVEKMVSPTLKGTTGVYLSSIEFTPEYRISYNAGGGSCSKTSELTKSGYLYDLPTPTRAGYVFDGWYTGPYASERVYSKQKFNNNCTIYAHWTSESNIKTISKVDITNVTLPMNGKSPVYTGSKSAGWHYITDLDEFLDFGNMYDTYAVLKNGIVWTDEYGYLLTPDKAVFSAGNKYLFMAYLAAEEGYKFADTIACSINGSTTLVKVKSAHTKELYIESAPLRAECNVTFYPGDGYCFTNSAKTSNGKLTSLPTATRSGYKFDGWYTSYTGGTKIDTSTSFSKDTNVYAHYKKYYNVKVTGGSADQTQAAEGDIVNIEIYSPQDGYFFDMWSSQDVNVFNKKNTKTYFTMPEKDVEVIAVFEKAALTGATYNIGVSTPIEGEKPSTREDAVISGTKTGHVEIASDADFVWYKGGVSGTIMRASETFTEGETYTLKVTLRIKAGSNYRFDLSSAANSPKVTINNRQTITTSSSTMAETCYYTFTVEEPVYYSVQVTNGTASQTSALEGEKITITADRAQAGYIFDSWVSSTATVADAKNENTYFVMPKGDVSITAKYKKVVLSNSTFDISIPVPVAKAVPSTIININLLGMDIAQVGISSDSEYTWYKGDNSDVVMGASETFENGNSYTLKVKLKIKETSVYCFDTSSAANGTKVTINGQSAIVTARADKEMDCYYVYSLEDVIEDTNSYAIFVNGGTADKVKATEGETVNLTAYEVVEGYVFDGWSSDEVTVYDAKNPKTYFIMPKEEVTITANFKKTEEGKTPGDSGTPSTPGKEDANPPSVAPKDEPIDNPGNNNVALGESYNVASCVYKVTNADMTGKGTVTLTKAAKSKSRLTTVTIPSAVKINGKTFKVTAIADHAFKNCTKLKKITIGSNITKIGKNAFYGCKSLKTITVKSKKIKSVGKNACKGIHKKCKIKVPGSKLKAYKKTFARKGQAKTVKISK